MKKYLLDIVDRLKVGMSRPRWEDLNGQFKISRNTGYTPTGLIITRVVQHRQRKIRR